MRYEIFLTKFAYPMILLLKVIPVGGFERIPKFQELSKDCFDEEPSPDIDPDEVVVVGATPGDTHLGGEDFDNHVMFETYEINNSSNQFAMSKLKTPVVLAKRTLSLQRSATIEIEDFECGHGFLETFTREQFEPLNLELSERTMKCVDQVLNDAKVIKSEIDEV